MTHNINPIDFSLFFIEHIQKDILDSLYVYKLINKSSINLRNNETYRIISYFTLYHLLKKINEHNFEKNVIVVQPYIINHNIEICEYCDYRSLDNLFKKILKPLIKSYPNNVILLKKDMALESPDLKEYLFKKCNMSKTSTFKSLKNFAAVENLKLPV